MSRDFSENGTRKRNDLKTYYGIEAKAEANALNIDGKDFNAEIYVDKLVKESNLKQLIEKERELVQEIQSLDSEMQTLVYENYNKFILATDTICQMKSDFKSMEDEMEKLVVNMSNISTFAQNISSNLQDRRQQITKLSNMHELLKNLQFLFDLPQKLKCAVEDDNYSLAVKYYAKSEKVLKEFGDHPSFNGIQSECQDIKVVLKQKLQDQFIQSDITSPELEQSVVLMCQLGESPAELAIQFLQISQTRLNTDLDDLASFNISSESNEDAIPLFIEKCCNTALNHIALTVATYNNFFPTEASKNNQIINLAENCIEKLLPIVESKLIELIMKGEMNESWCLLVVAALDKFHRRLLAVQRLLLSDKKWSQPLITVISRSVSNQMSNKLQAGWDDQLREWRDMSKNDKLVYDSVKQLEASIVENLQRSFVALTAFVGNHVTFSQDWQFRQAFGRYFVREDVFMATMKQLSKRLTDLSYNTGKEGLNPTQILSLSRVAFDFSQHLSLSLIALVEEQFDIPSGFHDANLSTSVSSLTQQFKLASQRLLRHYVQNESHTLVQMLRKSMDSRDWLTASEPRSVRPVFKRILEEITRVDSHAAELYEEGSRKEQRSSESSSRRTHLSSAKMQQPKSSWSSLGPSQMDSSLLNNIQKLFSEKIDLSGTIEPNRASIVMAIIKTCLKGFLEFVRLKTFGKFGFQQVQVDCHYLQLFLWRFTADDNFVHGLLDEVLSSAVQRCLEPVLMEPSVVELICER